ncbi:MAG: class I SAM-dependent methyltransferase [Planctomycetota bacterium]|nr:class I SAM-dependent methyltransferase [Planctomycetota bacterium]
MSGVTLLDSRAVGPFRQCPLCQSKDADPFLEGARDLEYGTGGEHLYVKCRGCSFVIMDPIPPFSEIVTFYPSDYHAYQEGDRGLARALKGLYSRMRAKQFSRLIGTTGHICEIGASDGEFLHHLQEVGDWQLSGVELDPEMVERARAKGLDIRHSTFEQAGYPAESFDLVVMSHLIEHVQDPVETMAETARTLKPGGCVVGETPNIASWDYKIFGRFWGGFHVPRHLYLFSGETLRRLLEKAGFEEIRLIHAVQPSHWAIGVQNFLRGRNPSPSRLEGGRAFYFPLLLLAFLPIQIVQSLLGASSIIGFEARKSGTGP